MEYWDIYDIERAKTGRTMVRGDAFRQGDLHLAIHICIFNAKDQMLIQQRQPFKSDWPGMWDITVGGSAVKGDDSQTAASRELFEELGITYDLTGIRPSFTINFDHGFDDHYIIEKEVELSELTLQYEEVQAVRWAAIEEIFEMIDNGSFIPYHKSIIQLLFDSRKGYGSTR